MQIFVTIFLITSLAVVFSSAYAGILKKGINRAFKDYRKGKTIRWKTDSLAIFDPFILFEVFSTLPSRANNKNFYSDDQIKDRYSELQQFLKISKIGLLVWLGTFALLFSILALTK